MRIENRESLTAAQLKEWLHFDPSTGLFTWLRSPRFNVEAGSVAGHLIRSRKHRSIVIGIGGRYYLAHRLAWLYMTGQWPDGRIDHFNGCPADNKFKNLRDTTAAINSQNRRLPSKSSTTGFLGVTETGSKSKPYRAQLTVNGRNRYVGIFTTPEEAYGAYVDAKRLLHEGCTI